MLARLDGKVVDIMAITKETAAAKYINLAASLLTTAMRKRILFLFEEERIIVAVCVFSDSLSRCLYRSTNHPNKHLKIISIYSIYLYIFFWMLHYLCIFVYI